MDSAERCEADNGPSSPFSCRARATAASSASLLHQRASRWDDDNISPTRAPPGQLSSGATSGAAGAIKLRRRGLPARGGTSTYISSLTRSRLATWNPCSFERHRSACTTQILPKSILKQLEQLFTTLAIAEAVLARHPSSRQGPLRRIWRAPHWKFRAVAGDPGHARKRKGTGQKLDLSASEIICRTRRSMVNSM